MVADSGTICSTSSVEAGCEKVFRANWRSSIRTSRLCRRTMVCMTRGVMAGYLEIGSADNAIFGIRVTAKSAECAREMWASYASTRCRKRLSGWRQGLGTGGTIWMGVRRRMRGIVLMVGSSHHKRGSIEVMQGDAESSGGFLYRNRSMVFLCESHAVAFPLRIRVDWALSCRTSFEDVRELLNRQLYFPRCTTPTSSEC